MIHQSAFSGEHEKLLKGALHSHTTRSDGRLTPEDVMRLHKKNGYDFMAITDHRRYNFNNFAPDTDILVIPGMEIDQNIEGMPGIHCFHTVVLGDIKENGNPFEQDQFFDFTTVKDQDDFQHTLDRFHEAGQYTMYCHPEWSFTFPREYERLKGNFAMEIWNSGCVFSNGLDSNAAGWDELLSQGKRIFGCATDDGHHERHHCHGWVNVNSEKNVGAILTSLSQGAFYSSCGPEIYDFYFDNGVVGIKCSPCTEVVFRWDNYPGPRRCSENGDLVCFEQKVHPSSTYVRATILDKDGKRAWTNPIFLK